MTCSRGGLPNHAQYILTRRSISGLSTIRTDTFIFSPAKARRKPAAPGAQTRRRSLNPPPHILKRPTTSHRIAVPSARSLKRRIAPCTSKISLGLVKLSLPPFRAPVQATVHFCPLPIATQQGSFQTDSLRAQSRSIECSPKRRASIHP